MAAKDDSSARVDSGASEEARVCPACGESRPATAFRSAHPRTHCDVCREAKEAGKAGAKDSEPTAEAAPEEDLVAQKRRRYLDRVSTTVPDICPVTGLDLEAAPRSHPRTRPELLTTDHGTHWVSAVGARLLLSGATPEELEHAAAWLRAREG